MQLQVLLANAFALESPNIRTETIEATEFMDLARQHQVMGVPRTVVTCGIGIEGAMPEETFLDSIPGAVRPPAS